METMSNFKIAAVNESLSMLPTPLTVDVREGWTSDGSSQDLAIRPLDGDDNIKFIPVLHVAELDDDLTPSEIAGKIADTYNNEVSTLDFDTNKARSRDYIMSRVYPRLIDSDKAAEAKRAGIITEDFLDMHVYYAVTIREDVSAGEIFSYSLDDDNLNSSGLSLDEVRHAALENVRNDVTLESIEDVLGLSDGSNTLSSFYVMSNRSRHYGASVMLLDDKLQDLERKFKSYHILPSSVHEVLIVPDTLGIDEASLREMVVDVNQDLVSPRDRLSDNIYSYRNGRLELVKF